MSEGKAPATDFKDTSTECGICLASFEEDKNKTVIKLSCGHLWHLDCLREQLQHVLPSHSQRLIFHGCRCAKCGVVCHHEALEHLTRKTDVLRDRVDQIVKEQLQIDLWQEWRDATGDSVKQDLLMEEGRRKYAFYLCSACDSPYFGGTVDCADQEEGERPSQDRLCSSCTPQSQIACAHAVEHRAFHAWKCRYCCSVASFVCYGTVHFCQNCHERNGQRERERQRMGGRHSNTGGPPPLEPVQCPGGDNCPFPKPAGQDHHSNGAASACEQVYHCTMCLTAPQAHAFALEPGSQNFLKNPCGEEGLNGWVRKSRASWKVETSAVPLNETITTNFVSSFQWCVMAQGVALHRYVSDLSTVRVEVAAKIMGRTDCPSVFHMKAFLLDAQRRVLRAAATPVIDAPADFWERVSLVLEATQDTKGVVVILHGKDKLFWGGDYGSKVTDCSVRVLGTEAELGNILRDTVEPEPAGEDSSCTIS